MRYWVFASTVAFLASACGGTSAGTEGLPYPATAVSSDGSYLLEASTLEGAPIVRGVHTFDITVRQASDGEAVTGLTLTVKPWMPSMGHGAPYDGSVVELAKGAYRAEGVSLFMAGVWELRTTIEPGSEHATLSFDVR